MRIAGTVSESIVDGPGLRLTVFTQGCPHHCPGCHNPQTHDPAGGREESTAALLARYAANPLLDGLTLSGGEPMEQAAECAALAEAVHALGGNVWVYTGWRYEAFDKLRIEAPYHALTNGGHISYIEMDGDPLQNLPAFEKVVRFMGQCGIGYGSINHPVDRDPVCGFNGIIGDTCPRCGRRETPDQPFERIRRITGYLVGTLDRFNNGKRAEERDRVKHGVTD